MQLDLETASKIPPNILFGTSTWTYPGWKGLVYRRDYKSDAEFKRECLAEYCTCPWFRTVGIDSSFYAPLRPQILKLYQSKACPNFRWVAKVWERITIPTYPGHARYGKNAGKSNPDFLNARLFESDVLQPYREAKAERNLGAFVFQFPTISTSDMSKEKFLEDLRRFLRALPSGIRYAVEIRNKEYLSRDYFDVLNESGVTHCFNHWQRMPRLLDQMKAAADAGGIKADFLVARLLTPLGVSYEGAVKLFSPYESIKRPNPEMREDAARLAKRAIERNIEAFIIVNNRTEGNAPLTIEAIGKLVVEKMDPAGK